MSWFEENIIQVIFVAATLSGALGLWLMLPRGGTGGRRLGVVLGALSLSLFASQLMSLGQGEAFAQGVFYVLALVTVASAAATITSRNPVYSAIWFAMTLLGTAALFLLQGAQFLALATVVVYAGAILVTFLFVLMLANPKGQAYYDRLSWEAFLSATAGAVMVGILTMTAAKAFDAAGTGDGPAWADAAGAEALEGELLAQQHVARLGARMFSEYLIAIEVAGTLLLVALIGAVAIVAFDESKRVAEARDRHG